MKAFACLFLLFILAGCHRAAFKERWLKQTAPPTFTVGFETSKGYFEATITRELSPMAADRFYAQVKHGYYDHTLFYRVRRGYVAQFGSDDSVKIKQWSASPLPDEPVMSSNERGAISFARQGKNSRGNDLFINTGNNSPFLDTVARNSVKGYPPLGTINKGMNVVDSLYDGYGDSVFEKYTMLLHNNQLFRQNFPALDSVKRVFLVQK